ncbi:MAG: hypothetical protein ABFQ62_03950 [Patescibacteria group bacterium]
MKDILVFNDVAGKKRELEVKDVVGFAGAFTDRLAILVEGVEGVIAAIITQENESGKVFAPTNLNMLLNALQA